MNNFPTFDNLYGNLAQATYPKNPNDFAIHSRKKAYVKFDFSQGVSYNGQVIPGGQNLPNNGVVYLQPAPKGRMSDPLTGFNAYYLTDTPQVDGTTKQTAKEEITMRA